MNPAARWLAILLLAVAPPVLAQGGGKVLRITFQAGKIVGLDELNARAKAGAKFDYDTPVAGLQTPDRYTLVVKLKQADRDLSYILAFPVTSAVAREVVEAYGDETPSHPVGTGPFYLKRYVRSSKIVLARNPDYRGKTWDFEPGDNPRFKRIAERMQG